MMTVGLDALSFDIPQNYINLIDLAQARGVDPGKYTSGLGQREMAVSSPCEDPVTLAAGAGRRALRNFDIDPNQIGLVIVGTETGIDHSKPVSIYVHELLGLPQYCRAFEVKHACYGAMAGLSMATHWIQSGKAKGRAALVIASDIARYGLNSAGEPTQGAGAVAMIISENPRLLEFDVRNEGYYSKQVMDFWRPNYSKEAVVDGHYSISCYLEALTGSYQTYKQNFISSSSYLGHSGHSGARFLDRFAACLYHVPFVKMAQKAHQRLLEADACIAFEKGSPQMQAAVSDFLARVSPSLELNARVGNIYTGSLFLSLLNFLEDHSDLATGSPISLFGYGSGCAAEFMSAVVLEGASSLMKQHSFRKILSHRKQIDIPTYEKLILASAQADLNNTEVCKPELWNIQNPILYLGTRDHKRQYTTSSSS